MKRVSLLTLVFAILSLAFIVLSVFLRFKFPPYPLVSYQDALDVLTPVVLIPLYWLMFKYAVGERPTLIENLAFLLLAVIWIEGHGMHLSANSVDNLIDALAANPATNIKGTDVYRLVFFFDEQLGHYLWHTGLITLPLLLIYFETRHAVGSPVRWWATILAGVIYGITLFCIFIQARTLFMGFPFAIAVALFGLIWGRNKLAQRPVLAFFFVSCIVAILLFSGWGLYWGGFPQFTAVGIIK